MDGAKLNLVQVAASKAVETLSSMAAPIANMKAVVSLSQLSQNPPSYEYRSNDIIQTLEDLLDVFFKNKKEQDNEEFGLRSAWEKKDLNLKNIRKFSEKDKAEFE